MEALRDRVGYAESRCHLRCISCVFFRRRGACISHASCSSLCEYFSPLRQPV